MPHDTALYHKQAWLCPLWHRAVPFTESTKPQKTFYSLLPFSHYDSVQYTTLIKKEESSEYNVLRNNQSKKAYRNIECFLCESNRYISYRNISIVTGLFASQKNPLSAEANRGLLALGFLVLTLDHQQPIMLARRLVLRRASLHVQNHLRQNHLCQHALPLLKDSLLQAPLGLDLAELRV